MSNLGQCYEHGHGITADERNAFTWYLKGAEAGEAQAQFNVGSFYARGKGEGRVQDMNTAIKRCKRAAAIAQLRTVVSLLFLKNSRLDY